MGTFDKVLSAITDTIKMNDRLISLAEKVRELSIDVHDINNRLIRLETYVEIAEKQRLLKKN